MKWNGLFALMLVGLMAGGCENDDSPSQAGACTITVVNSTKGTITAKYWTQTWDILTPGVDASHQTTKDVGPGQESDLRVYFDNELGTSRINVVKDGAEHNYDVGFGDHSLIVMEKDFTK